MLQSTERTLLRKQGRGCYYGNNREDRGAQQFVVVFVVVAMEMKSVGVLVISKCVTDRNEAL